MNELGKIENALEEIARNTQDTWRDSDRHEMTRLQREMVELQKKTQQIYLLLCVLTAAYAIAAIIQAYAALRN